MNLDSQPKVGSLIQQIGGVFNPANRKLLRGWLKGGVLENLREPWGVLLKIKIMQYWGLLPS